MTYNGWTNYETWNVVLYVDNIEDLYWFKNEFLEAVAKRGDEINGKEVHELVTALFPNGTPDMEGRDGWEDAVNWNEIADHWKEDFTCE